MQLRSAAITWILLKAGEMAEVPLTAHSVLLVPLLQPRSAGWPQSVADRPVALLQPLLGHAMGLGYIADVVEKQEKN